MAKFGESKSNWIYVRYGHRFTKESLRPPSILSYGYIRPVMVIFISYLLYNRINCVEVSWISLGNWHATGCVLPVPRGPHTDRRLLIPGGLQPTVNTWHLKALKRGLTGPPGGRDQLAAAEYICLGTCSNLDINVVLVVVVVFELLYVCMALVYCAVEWSRIWILNRTLWSLGTSTWNI